MSGYTGTQFELLYSQPASVTKNTYTTQAPISAAGTTSIPRCMIPAGYFSAIGKCIHVKASGTIQSAAGTATFIYAAGLDATAGTIAGTGGATLFTTATTTPATGTWPFELDMDIVCQAVGNLGTTVQCNGRITQMKQATSVWATAFPDQIMWANNLTGLNNEITLFLELFGTWSASSGTNSTILSVFKVYGEN